MSNYQRIYDDGIVWNGNTGTLVVKYEANAVSSDSTGLGLRIHFDSTSMVVAQSSGVVVEKHGALIIGSTDTVPDSVDFDNNEATDSLVGINYVSLTGGWPGDAALPSNGDDVVLATLTFEKIEGGNNNFAYDYTSSSTPPMYDDFINDPTPPPPPMGLVVDAIDENSGAGQVVATVENAPEGATFSLAGGNEFNAPEQQADTAHIFVSDAVFSEDGNQLTVSVAMNLDNGTTGLGLRVHYDSSLLTLAEQQVNGYGAMVVPSVPAEDNNDFDADGATDNYIGINYVAMMGSWPAASGADNTEMAVLTFDIADGQTGPFDINFTSSSTPPGLAFAGQNQTVSLPDNTFTINPETGEVTLTVNPDYEAQPEYDIKVVASTGDQAEETLEINNLDEVAPTITSEAVADAIDENSVAQVIYEAKADDSLDISAGVTFSLSVDSDSALSINAATGEVSINGSADYETQSVYSFTVIASDGVNEDVAQAVTLDINNLDELGPIFESGDTADAIDENSGAGQVVYTASAQDDGSDVTSEPLTYSLSDDSNGSFDIDAATGVVTLVENPDFEAQSQYSFSVVATDETGNSSEQSVSLE